MWQKQQKWKLLGKVGLSLADLKILVFFWLYGDIVSPFFLRRINIPHN